jgi:Fe-S cluster assembly protein SufB
MEKKKTMVRDIDRTVYDIKDKVNASYQVEEGLTPEIVEEISKQKNDPEWMREFRLKSLEIYNRTPMPNWGPPLDGLHMQDIITYIRPNTPMRGNWAQVPDDIKNTFERLGIPEAERKSLAGVGAQYDSEVVYHNVREEVRRQGVVYTDMESACPRPGVRPDGKRAFHEACAADRPQIRCPARGGLVGRFLRLRSAARQGGDPAPVVFPAERAGSRAV